MPSNEAKALAAALLASYPGSYVTEMTVLAIGDSLDRIGLDIAVELVDRARTEFLKAPSVAEIHELARDIRREAEESDHSTLALSPGEFLAEMPPEVRERVLAMQEKWAQIDDEDEIDPDAEWQRRLQVARQFGSLQNVKACSGAGQVPVEREGKLTCPDCDVEVPDHIVRIPKREASA
jgi:hypothetical protein